MKKSGIAKDWFLSADTSVGRRDIRAKLDKRIVKTVSDLPILMSVEETAEKMRSSPKTVNHWFVTKQMRSIKIGRRRYTTPEWIQDYIEMQARKHG